MTYVATSPIKHNGVVFNAGDEITDASPEELELLVASGVVEDAESGNKNDGKPAGKKARTTVVPPSKLKGKGGAKKGTTAGNAEPTVTSFEYKKHLYSRSVSATGRVQYRKDGQIAGTSRADFEKFAAKAKVEI